MAKTNRNDNITLIPFVAFDLETTGLSAGRDKIVEISGIKFQNGVTFSTFDTLIDPEIPIPPEITRINGITDEMVAGKPTIETALPCFLEFIRGCVLIAHNAPFDVGFLNAALAAQGLSPINTPVTDTLVLSRKAIPGQVNYKLQTLAAHLKIDPGNAHRAKDDALVCRDIFCTCVERITGGEVMSLEKLLLLAKP